MKSKLFKNQNEDRTQKVGEMRAIKSEIKIKSEGPGKVENLLGAPRRNLER